MTTLKVSHALHLLRMSNLIRFFCSHLHTLSFFCITMPTNSPSFCMIKIAILCPKHKLLPRGKVDDMSIILPRERFDLTSVGKIAEEYGARITTCVDNTDRVMFKVSAFETLSTFSPTRSAASDLKHICRNCEGDGVFSIKILVKKNRSSCLDKVTPVMRFFWEPIVWNREPNGDYKIEIKGTKFHVKSSLF